MCPGRQVERRGSPRKSSYDISLRISSALDLQHFLCRLSCLPKYPSQPARVALQIDVYHHHQDFFLERNWAAN
jgi:hypothetical protein